MSETKVPLFVCGKDNRPMVKVPAGEFLYGEDQEKTETKEFSSTSIPSPTRITRNSLMQTGHTEPASCARVPGRKAKRITR